MVSVPQGHLAMSGDTFDCYTWRAFFFLGFIYFLAMVDLGRSRAFSSCSKQGASLQFSARRLLIARQLLLVLSVGSRWGALSSCGSGASLPRGMESSWSRAQTGVLSTARRVVNHWTTKEAPGRGTFDGMHVTQS